MFQVRTLSSREFYGPVLKVLPVRFSLSGINSTFLKLEPNGPFTSVFYSTLLRTRIGFVKYYFL